MYHSKDTVNANTSVPDLAPDIAVKRYTGKVGFIDQGYTSDHSTLWVLFSNPTLRKKSPQMTPQAFGPPSDPKTPTTWYRR